jgi:uncharacterized membrane protein YhaH (DUF805 family)
MFCNNCGAKLDSDSEFCANCGKRVKSDAVKEITEQNPSFVPRDERGWFVRFYQGRLGRKYWIFGNIFWFFILIIFIAIGALLLTSNNNNSDLFTWFFLVAIIIFYYLTLSLSVRRFHDMDQTGWMVLTFVIPLVNLIMLVYMLITEGAKEENKYGSPLPRNKGFFDTILNK